MFACTSISLPQFSEAVYEGRAHVLQTIEMSGWRMTEILDAVRAGDLLVFGLGRRLNHVGIACELPGFIHATQDGVLLDRLYPGSVWARRWRLGLMGPW